MASWALAGPAQPQSWPLGWSCSLLRHSSRRDRSGAARAHRFLCCKLTSWECFPALWLLFSPDFFEQALLQCLLPSGKGSAPLSLLGTGAVTRFCVSGMSPYSKNREFCVLQQPGWALWDWGSSLPSAPPTAKGALELHGVLASFSSWQQGRTSHPGPEQHPLGRTGTRHECSGWWWRAVAGAGMLREHLGAAAASSGWHSRGTTCTSSRRHTRVALPRLLIQGLGLRADWERPRTAGQNLPGFPGFASSKLLHPSPPPAPRRPKASRHCRQGWAGPWAGL